MIHNRAVLFVFLIYCAPAVEAQSSYLKQTVGVGVGAGLPQGYFARYYFGDSPGIVAEYSYRFHRTFQADVAVDTVIGGNHLAVAGAAHYHLTTNTTAQLLFPFGGRAMLPIQNGRLLLSLGAGPAYMYYTSPGAGETSYGGWGWYALGAGTVAIDKSLRFCIGVAARNYRGKATSSGRMIGNGRDRWVNVYCEFTFNF